MASGSTTVIKTVAERLLASGLRRARPGIFVRPGTSEVMLWVGLNQAKRGGVVELNPVVGFRHEKIEDLVSEFTDERSDGIVPPTAAMNAGYLTSSDRYLAFVFDGVRRDEELVSELVGIVVEAGERLLRQNKTLDEIADGLRTAKRLIPEQVAYRLPVALFLAGRASEASQTLEGKVREIGERADPAAVRYRRFAERFAARIAGEHRT